MNKSKLNIELCCFSASGLSNLDESIRIELCSNYLEGGLSPTANLFFHIRSLFNNKIVSDYIVKRSMNLKIDYKLPWING